MVAHNCHAHKINCEDLQVKSATMVAVYVYGIYQENATMVAHNYPAHKMNCEDFSSRLRPWSQFMYTVFIKRMRPWLHTFVLHIKRTATEVPFKCIKF